MHRTFDTVGIGAGRLAVVLAGLLIAQGAGAAEGIKCWTNRDGVRECGDTVPPEYSQQGYERINDRGVTVGRQQRAKSAQELADERAQAALEQERLREEAKSKARDRVLLDTFSSVDDIEMARNGQLSNIEGQIKVTEGQIEKLNVNLASMIEDAAATERRGQQPSEDVKKNIEEIRRQIADNGNFIVSKRKEQDAVREEYNRDIDRFRELKGLVVENSPAPAAATARPNAQLASP